MKIGNVENGMEEVPDGYNGGLDGSRLAGEAVELWGKFCHLRLSFFSPPIHKRIMQNHFPLKKSP